jgi:DNA repair protein RecN (Recombination protein N)
VALAAAPGSPAPPTFVFDEVDAGIGGRAAVEVGRRLAELGRTAQVVVVTHLAQVAAFADRHLVVTKTSRGGEEVVTDSGVRPVHGPDRVRELARMLSGQEDSTAALRHAEELLTRATVRA